MKVQKKHGRGNHLIMDCFSCDSAVLDNKKEITKILLELPSIIGMRKISKPLVLHHHAKKKSESGITGTIILAESNITIHTYPEKRFVSIDVYSCKEFDIGKAINYLKKKFKFKKLKKHIIRRGFY